mgnify:CR=1 FL=1
MNTVIGISAIATNISGQLSKLPDVTRGERTREKLDSKREVATTYSISIIRAKSARNHKPFRTSIFSFFEYTGRMLENLSLYEEEKYYYENHTTKTVIIAILTLLFVNILIFALGLILPNRWAIISLCSNLIVLLFLPSMVLFQYHKRKAILKYLDLYNQKWESFELQYRNIVDLYLTISEGGETNEK